MKEISYQVQGSASEPYDITISLNGSNLKSICNCGAGKNGMHCKHWMHVFEGKKQKYINLDDSQIEEIQSWLAGSDLEEAWQEFEAIKVQEEQIKRELAIKKKAVMTKFKSAMKK